MLGLVCVLLFCSPQGFDKPVEIGEIELFGQTGVDGAAIRRGITVREGDKITADKFGEVKANIESAVQKVVGKPATDVALVGFDEKGKLMIFVGVPGPTVKMPPTSKPPHGPQRLAEEGMRLYDRFGSRLVPALQSGGGKEDDSKGYALFSDPELHAIQLDMRDFAVKHTKEVFDVLTYSGSVADRRAASEIAGYAERSKEQVDALMNALGDEDGTVRNNAIRSLGVILRTDKKTAASLSTEPFIDLVRSGTWTDRNKGAMVLDELTESRSKPLLDKVRKEALASLLEMAHWRNFPHARTALTILGRVAGIDEARLQKMHDSGDAAPIFKALGASTPSGRRACLPRLGRA
ncbi:MAG TPA: HEAT repeat domain-containing protein [Fimbriimonadaceae bacterium]|nr:HEAT repeat domain-containing protein [Fimbriimonadaceae bacterium]